MRRNKKQMTTYFILCSLLLIGVVYAILQANLQINGTAKIKANTWDIHFDNIVVNENSVSIGENDSAATIDPENNCKVDFEVTLSLPGDYYEFTVDVVNAGTIDGMIGELNKTLKVNNETVSEVPNYLNYDVTYSDGVEIENNHKITAGTTETYLVRLEFKNDIEELPNATTITTSLTPQYLQADSSAETIIHYKKLYDVLKNEAESDSGLAQEYTGSHQDSFSGTGTEKIYYWYAPNDDNATSIINKWNVIFGGFCWQIWRTTDTGGIKLIYAGIPNEGKCNIIGNPRQIGTSTFNDNRNSPAYAGYMYNSETLITFVATGEAENGSIYGEEVNYDDINEVYYLVNTSTIKDENHHYTCNNTTGVCSTVRFYYYNVSYTELSDGRNIEEALADMLSADNVNQTNSTIKTYIDTWYQNNMTAYTSKLEDTIFCNDRSIQNLGGWKPNGGPKYSYLTFKNYNDANKDLSCEHVTDQFSMNNSKARLTYPVGLMTYAEANLLDNKKLRNTGNHYWLLSPYFYGDPSYFNSTRYVYESGSLSYSTNNQAKAVRPVVSLKPGTMYRYGDGSMNNPYIIE